MITLQENAYITIAEADVFFQGYLNGVFWESITPEMKERYIITASKEIDRAYPYIGYRSENTQAMEFPRNLYGYIDSRNDVLFQNLKDAVCYQIEKLYKTQGETDEIDDLRNKGVSSFDIGGVSGDINLNRDTLKLAPKAFQCMNPYICKSARINRYRENYVDRLRNEFLNKDNIV